jgi:prevent-host-death family protein
VDKKRGVISPLAFVSNVIDHAEMKRTLPIGEAKPQLCGLVQAARQGLTSVITVNDEPAAALVPIESSARRLTEEWRRRCAQKNIRLNRPGQKKLTLTDLIQQERP